MSKQIDIDQLNFPEDGKTYGAKDGQAVELKNFDFLEQGKWNKYWAKATGGGISYYGTAQLAPTGTQSDVYLLGRTYRQIASTAVAGNTCEFRESSFGRKSAYEIGTLSMLVYFDNNGSTDFRCIGGATSVSVIGNIDPSTANQGIFIIGADSADTNYQFMYKSIVGEPINKMDLGWSKSGGRKEFLLQLSNDVPNGNTKVFIRNITQGLTFETTINQTFFGSFRVWANNGTDAIAVNTAVGYIELNVRNNV